MTVRPLQARDLPSIESIQALSPETPAWPVESYPQTLCLVAIEERSDGEETVLGFAAARQIVPQEAEILNLAVHPSARRRGIARAILLELLNMLQGEVFLEVRTSNRAAILLYESLHFARVGIRTSYYSNPGEDAIVLRLQAC
ncbi:MAG: ribosomal protein S18-alanine N-acetyltransferase [Bryobacterales bacterium]|nr:ribosomal protein S18-alanine N-acetyltransferase [Bryobacterales bacterium]